MRGMEAFAVGQVTGLGIRDARVLAGSSSRRERIGHRNAVMARSDLATTWIVSRHAYRLVARILICSRRVVDDERSRSLGKRQESESNKATDVADGAA